MPLRLSSPPVLRSPWIASPLRPRAASASFNVGLRLLFLPPSAPLCSRMISLLDSRILKRVNEPRAGEVARLGRAAAALRRSGRAFAETGCEMVDREPRFHLSP